jgi:zinc transport system substrate-binding protein
LLDVLGDAIKEEEVIEGMEGGEGEEGNEENGGPEYDEHVWLSVKNAKILVSEITDTIQDTDPENEGKYAKNSEEYIGELDELDGEYEQMVQEATYNTVLFGDRFPFRYLVDDYGLNYYAAFVGCSAESEASFETITYLSKKVDEYGIPAVLVIENSDQKIAETIVQNTKSKNQDILVMNSLQSITNSDISNGLTYLQAMKDNLEIFRQALN